MFSDISSRFLITFFIVFLQVWSPGQCRALDRNRQPLGTGLLVGGIHAQDSAASSSTYPADDGGPFFPANASGEGQSPEQDMNPDSELDPDLEYDLESSLEYNLDPDLENTARSGYDLQTVYLRKDLEKQIFALLSKCSYSKKTCFLPSVGWHRLAKREITALGLDPNLFDSASGFHAELFKTPSGKYIIGFEGTDSLRDILTDIAQGVPSPLVAALGIQYSQAARLAKTAGEQLGDNLIAFTGHSLGGGLASLAGLLTGKRAVTFNAAGLNPLTMDMQVLASLAERHHALKKIFNLARNWRHRDNLITAYQVKGDELTFFQEKLKYIPTTLTIGLDLILPDAVGRQVQLENPGGPDLHPEHGIDEVLSAGIR